MILNCPDSSVMLDEFQSAKSCAVMLISYGTPGGTLLNLKAPLAGVVTTRGSLLSKLFNATLAFGTGSPFTSRAVPTMVPDSGSDSALCPNKQVGSMKIIASPIAK